MAVDMDVVRDKTLAILDRSTGLKSKAEDLLVEDLGLDSLDTVELSIDLEEAFGIEIEDALIRDRVKAEGDMSAAQLIAVVGELLRANG